MARTCAERQRERVAPRSGALNHQKTVALEHAALRCRQTVARSCAAGDLWSALKAAFRGKFARDSGPEFSPGGFLPAHQFSSAFVEFPPTEAERAAAVRPELSFWAQPLSMTGRHCGTMRHSGANKCAHCGPHRDRALARQSLARRPSEIPCGFRCVGRPILVGPGRPISERLL